MSNGAVVLNFSRKFEVVECAACAGPVVLTELMVAELRRTHHTFYCPAGHPMSFPGKSESEKLREQLAEKERLLAAESERAATNYRQREKAERELKKLKKRTSGGACPCCNRTFVALGRHMKAKHPDFAGEGA